MIGKKILVGLTYLDKDGELDKQVQLHGTIKSIEDHNLTFTKENDGGDFTIPFDGEPDEADPENIYTLRTTGEKVTGVNYISTFTIHKTGENDS